MRKTLYQLQADWDEEGASRLVRALRQRPVDFTPGLLACVAAFPLAVLLIAALR